MQRDPLPAVLIVAIAAFVLIGFWLLRRYKPKHAPGEFDPALRPRPVLPTQPDVEPEVAAQLAPAPTLNTNTSQPTNVEQALAEVEAVMPIAEVEPEPERPKHDPNVCFFCEQRDPDGLIEFEDWQQVESTWGRILASRKRRLPVDPGRELYLIRACRACAAVADHLNKLFEAREKAIFAARRRVWERRGLRDAVRRANSEQERAYDEEQKAIEKVDRMKGNLL